jgi:hypothetical protein
VVIGFLVGWIKWIVFLCALAFIVILEDLFKSKNKRQIFRKKSNKKNYTPHPYYDDERYTHLENGPAADFHEECGDRD